MVLTLEARESDDDAFEVHCAVVTVENDHNRW